jgi:hypothetical protein
MGIQSEFTEYEGLVCERVGDERIPILSVEEKEDVEYPVEPGGGLFVVK